MKSTFFALYILSATAALAQYSGHPQHADIVPLAQEQNILAPSNYFVAHGERPASDFPQTGNENGNENGNEKKTVISLGTTAREIRKQHAEQKRSLFVWVN